MKNLFENFILNFSTFIYDPIIFRGLGVLLQIIMIIVILWWIIKKIYFLKSNSNSSKIRILSYVSVGPNEKILIVDFQEVKLILGVTIHSINILYIFPLTSQCKK